jgi:hypothetical protein
MTLSIIDLSHTASEDLLPLRRMIVRLANRCRLDLADSSAIRRFLDSDYSQCEAPDWDINSCRDLHSMITLLFRLEASTSEDIGINGLHSLWRQHHEILAGFNSGEAVQDGFQKGLVLV